MHTERAALIIIGYRLDHRAEDVGVDLLPVEIADMKEVGARDLGKARNLCLCWVFGRKQPTIDVGKAICPTRQVSVPLVFGLRSEERRVGKEWVRKCRSRGSPYH